MHTRAFDVSPHVFLSIVFKCFLIRIFHKQSTVQPVQLTSSLQKYSAPTTDINMINVKNNVKKTLIGDKVAHLKQQKLDDLIDFHAQFHHYSAAGFY